MKSKSFNVVSTFALGNNKITITAMIKGVDTEARINRLMAANRKTAEKYQLEDFKTWAEPAISQDCLTNN